MEIDIYLEQHRLNTLSYERNHLATLDCSVRRYKNDIEYWSGMVEEDIDPICGVMLKSAKNLLADTLRRREACRVRIAKYEGFELARPDLN